MQQSSKKVTSAIINQIKPKTILDVPCGGGWLLHSLNYSAQVDGIDLYDVPKGSYRNIVAADLDHGIPKELPTYDCICSCEGIEHFGNPELFLRTAKEHLSPNGTLVITTPNIWYPAARLQFALRGFFPGFPCLTGRINKGSHMHIMPWSYPQLYLYLKLTGYTNIKLHHEPLSSAKHLLEKVLAIPQKVYCRSKARKSEGETKEFWQVAGSSASVHGRHLIVTAQRPA